MNTTIKTRKENLQMAIFICAMSLLVVGAIYMAFNGALAEGESALEGVVGLLVTIISIICGVVGVIFALIGVVKIAIAHANEDGPAQSKAAMMIATGIVLIILGVTITGMKSTILGWMPKG